MALDVEGVIDGGVDRQKALSRSRLFETLLLSFVSSSRLVRIFSTVVGAESLILDRTKPLVTSSDRIGFALVRVDARSREALFLQELSQRFPSRSSTASWLDQEIEYLAFVIDGPPEPVFRSRILITISSRCQRSIAGDQAAKLQKPAPNRLVRNIDATLCQQILYVAERHR
jgi:hypothetical protein